MLPDDSKIQVVVFKDVDGLAPTLRFLQELDPKTRHRCLTRIQWLRDFGHQLRRPAAAQLQDGIWELRIKYQRLNLRMLYFFARPDLAVLTHGFRKQQAKVPPREIRIAKSMRRRFLSSPPNHSLDLGWTT